MDCTKRLRGNIWPPSWQIVYRDSIYGNVYNFADELGFYEGRAMFEARDEFDKDTVINVHVEQTGGAVFVDTGSEGE